MNLADIPIFQLLQSKMGYLDARNRVLAENIANADTPDYKARDLAEFDFDKLVNAASTGGAARSGMRTSAMRHIAPVDARPPNFEAMDKADAQGSVNGNQVSLERQMMKVSETQMEHQTAASLYRKSLNMIRVAIGRGGGGAA